LYKGIPDEGQQILQHVEIAMEVGAVNTHTCVYGWAASAALQITNKQIKHQRNYT
jgi:hypothetical protein